MLLPICLKAQHFSKLNRFSIEFPQGCAPATVRVTEYTPPSQPTSFFYEEGQPDIADTSYTFTEPGTYQIIQLLGEDVTPKTDTLTFTVIDPPAPEFVVYFCSSNEVEVEITDTFYDSYRVYFGSLDSIDVQGSDPNPGYSFPDANANITVKGFLNNSFNGNCGTTEKSFTIPNSLFTPQITGTSLYRSCDDSYTLNIGFSNTSNFFYSIGFEANPSSGIWLYEGTLSDITSISGVELNGDTQKCLYVKVTDICNGNSVTSDPYCFFIDYQMLPRLQGAYATYSGANILLHFGLNDSYPLDIERSANNQNFTYLSQATGANFIDNVSGSPTYSYRVSFTDDSCDSTSQTILAPPKISFRAFDRETNQVTLNATAPVNVLNDDQPSKYVVLYSQDSSQLLESTYTNPFTLNPVLGEYQYIRLKYSYEDHVDIYSNALLAHQYYSVYVPKAFTPYNGDGLNDRLEFFGLPSEEGSFDIYNRWGEMIYSSDQLTLGWDGYTKQGKVPQGTYRYKIRFKTPGGDMKSQVGTFVLLRD